MKRPRRRRTPSRGGFSAAATLFYLIANTSSITMVSGFLAKGSKRVSSTRLSRLFMNNSSNKKWNQKYEELMAHSTLSLAPMMDYTDRHFRHLVRLLSQRTLLYTEMVAANALAYDQNNLERFLRQSSHEGASVLQLGGSDPDVLHRAAAAVWENTPQLCEYTALNLNCGCPSPKVAGSGCFGAALMEDPGLVSRLVRGLHEGCRGELPVTVKCRIGTDSQQHMDEYETISRFVETIATDGIVTDFQIHARIAVLKKSFSPADNRRIPPLKYDIVRRLVSDYPELTFSLNGGIETIEQVQSELEACPDLKGIMVGRAWAADPWRFAMVDELLYGCLETTTLQNRWEILKAYGKHADAEEERNGPLQVRRTIVKAITPLFAGEPKAKRYRIALDEIAGLPKRNAATNEPLSELILNAAATHLNEETLYRTRRESYERHLNLDAQERARRQEGQRSDAVSEWQAQRVSLS